MFKSLFAKIGLGGASIDTRFQNDTVLPGGILQGTVFVEGGSIAQQVADVYLYFKARVRHNDKFLTLNFYEAKIANAFQIAPEQKLEIPFSVQLPYELPITLINNQPIRMQGKLFVVTDMNIDDAIDAGDEDAFFVAPSPVIEAVLQTLYELKFNFLKVDIEKGRIEGATMPFFQEFEYGARDTIYAKKCKELEVTFIPKAHEVEVVLEIDKRGFFSGGDVFRRFTVPNIGFNNAQIMSQIHQLLSNL